MGVGVHHDNVNFQTKVHQVTKIILDTVSDPTRTKNTLVDVRPFPEHNIVKFTNIKIKNSLGILI